MVLKEFLEIIYFEKYQQTTLKSITILFSADVTLLQTHVGHMVSFIEHIALDEDHSDSNISACCGLIG